MRAVIMAGGKGERLRPLTDGLPKPLLPVANEPVICRIIRHLKKFNIDEITISLSYMPELIIDAVTEAFAGNFCFVIEKVPLGTAGGVKNAARDFDSPFLVISGDALADINLTALFESHYSSGAVVTLAVTHTDDVAQYGVIETDGKGFVKTFVEKPAENVTESHLVNCGIYVIDPKILELIPVGMPYDFSRDLFPDMLKRGQKISVFDMGGAYWRDIGSFDNYFMANADALSGVYNSFL